MGSCLVLAYPVALVPSAADIQSRAHLKAAIDSDIKMLRRLTVSSRGWFIGDISF